MNKFKTTFEVYSVFLSQPDFTAYVSIKVVIDVSMLDVEKIIKS